MINRSLSEKEIQKLFIQGVNDFNSKKFYEAHESWESIWHTCEGAEKKYYQALILLAGAGVHFQKKRFNPAQRLLALASIRLADSQEYISKHFDKSLLVEVHRHMTKAGIDNLPKLNLVV